SAEFGVMVWIAGCCVAAYAMPPPAAATTARTAAAMTVTRRDGRRQECEDTMTFRIEWTDHRNLSVCCVRRHPQESPQLNGLMRDRSCRPLGSRHERNKGVRPQPPTGSTGLHS